MSDKMKEKIAEFVALAKACPENLQEKCFELLLADHLEQLRAKRPRHDETHEQKTSGQPGNDKAADEGSDARKQEDIAETDLHVKARQFLKKSGLSIKDINELFYKEAGDFLPLYDDLKTTMASESQIRIALLHSLISGMHTGAFEFDGEKVRAEAQTRKSYDGGNFAANFKNNKDLFEGFSKYSKTSPTIRLSVDGKAKLAEVIKDLQ